MKQITSLIFILGISSVLLAQKKERSYHQQFAQGKWVFGTNAGLRGHTRVGEQLFYDIDGQLKAGYFIKDQWVAGLCLTKTMSFSSPAENTFYKTFLRNPTNFQAFSRYYFSGNRAFNLYGEAGGGVEYISPIRTSMGELVFGGSIPNAYAELGLSFPIIKKLTIDLGTNVNYRWATQGNALPYGFGGWMGFKLGVNFHF